MTGVQGAVCYLSSPSFGKHDSPMQGIPEWNWACIAPKRSGGPHFLAATHLAGNHFLAKQVAPLWHFRASLLDQMMTVVSGYREFVDNALPFWCQLFLEGYWSRSQESCPSAALTWQVISPVQCMQSRPHEIATTFQWTWLSSHWWLEWQKDQGPGMRNSQNVRMSLMVQSNGNGQQLGVQYSRQESRTGRVDYLKGQTCFDPEFV